MGTTVIKNTNIRELLEVSRGNMDVLKKMTDEFLRIVQNRQKVIDDRHTSMTTQRAINVVSEVIRENRENGELEGVLSRQRIAALNHLVRLAEGVKAIVEKSGPSES